MRVRVRVRVKGEGVGVGVGESEGEGEGLACTWGAASSAPYPVPIPLTLSLDLSQALLITLLLTNLRRSFQCAIPHRRLRRRGDRRYASLAQERIGGISCSHHIAQGLQGKVRGEGEGEG